MDEERTALVNWSSYTDSQDPRGELQPNWQSLDGNSHGEHESLEHIDVNAHAIGKCTVESSLEATWGYDDDSQHADCASEAPQASDVESEREARNSDIMQDDTDSGKGGFPTPTRSTHESGRYKYLHAPSWSDALGANEDEDIAMSDNECCDRDEASSESAQDMSLLAQVLENHRTCPSEATEVRFQHILGWITETTAALGW
ncbi:unnamed protein product [Somion occarium]|uniref:Uncharacterized protein n=1 Tax=Somion occarium TaxID=3059160 RepID=A0ABP1CW06_9APHY